MKTSDLLADYVTEAPNDQNPLDIFKGIWSSELPDPWKQLKAGSIPLLEDQRIVWAAEQLGGVRGLRVLELGPLEGGHTYMLESMGAESIVAVGVNKRAYLKCLVVKEILNLKRSRFLLGDFVQFLRNTQESFDVCLASGVLYHMLHPAELIDLISRSSRRIVLWITYYDEVIIQKAKLTHKFAGYVKKNHRGFEHVLHRYVYGDALDWGGFCGGSNSCS